MLRVKAQSNLPSRKPPTAWTRWLTRGIKSCAGWLRQHLARLFIRHLLYIEVKVKPE